MSCITAAMLPSLLGRPVAYQPVFTRLPGVTVQGAIFLSQALFLCNTPTAQRREGWFWKEQQGESDSWEAETGMSAKQQVTARRQLVAIGVLEEVRKGVPAKTWYRVNTEALAQRLAEVLSEEEVAEQPAAPATAHNLPSGESENAKPENQESPEGSAQNRPDGDFLQRLQQRNPDSLSGAAERETPDWFARSLADDGQPLGDPAAPMEAQLAHHRDRKQPMTLDWQPEPEHLAMACQRQGLPADTWPAPHQLASFTAHHADTGRTYGATLWHTKLADWLRNDLRAAPTTGGPAHDRTAADRPRHAQTEREAVRQQLANPHDTSWADGWWPDEAGAAQGAGAGAGEPDLQPAGGDLPEDVLECVPECGPAYAEQARAGHGAGPVAGAAHPAGGGTDDERAEAAGQHLAADDPCACADAGAHAGGRRHASHR